MTTVTPFHSNACALIIGINDYRAFDPTGARDLKGGAHDTVAIERCCTVLGMAPANIHVVRNDVESKGNPFVLKGVGDTTRKGLLAELAWLREQLDAGRGGLLWYSGHGAHTSADGLLLCPSDTTGDLGNTIPFRALRDALGPRAAESLTVVLDCCHGGPAVDAFGRPSTTLNSNTIAPGVADDDLQIGAVVLMACAPGEQAQQSWFSALPHGAFTWALLSVANQWEAAQQGGNVAMTLTYRQLLKKATILLDALEFEGTPQLYPQSAGGWRRCRWGMERCRRPMRRTRNGGTSSWTPAATSGSCTRSITATRVTSGSTPAIRRVAASPGTPSTGT